MLKMTNVSSQIFLVTGETKQEIAKAFKRMQEFYESPKYAGIYFTGEEFDKWYLETYGLIYENEWEGFNVPGHIVEQFWQKFVYTPKISDQETELLYWIKTRCFMETKWYLLGAIEGDKEIINHELCHALFYLDETYQKYVKEYLNGVQKDEIGAYLRKHGYRDQVIIDEINAYLVFGQKDLIEDGINVKNYEIASDSLRRLFDVCLERNKIKIQE